MKIRNDSRKGMSLVEITIVLVVLLVIFGAVFLFFSRSTEHFDFARRQNELITIGRLALEEVTDEIIYAGYMPSGGWSNDHWHPVVEADNDQFEFYADWDGTSTLLDTDYRLVALADESFIIADRTGDVRFVGSNITSLDFGYLDELHNQLPEPLDSLDRDLVRHVQITIELSDTWGSHSYATEVHTTITPRNLGMNHNINPAFFPPPELEGLVVFNVPGTGEDHFPDADELLMINRLLFWGLSVTLLNDEEMETYDFIGKGINLIILRHRGAGGVFPYPDILNNPLAAPLEIPVVTLNARDAADIFSMGKAYLELSNVRMTPGNTWHPVNRDLPGDPLATFFVYDSTSFGMQSVLDSMIYNSPGDTLLTFPGTLNNLSGVCVRDETTAHRRIHFSAYDASEYTTSGGWQMFYNVIVWGIGTPPSEYGTLLESEDFEDPDDYTSVDPGYTGQSWCHLVSQSVDIPEVMDGGYINPILRFDQIYWLRNKNQGMFLEVSSDNIVWDRIQYNTILDPDYYKIVCGPDYPGGMINTYREKSDGYNYPVSMNWETVTVDLEDFAGETLWFRFVFGAVPIPSNNQDGFVVDNFSVWADSVETGAPIRLDTWGDEYVFWDHDIHEDDSLLWTDCWAYLDLNETDPFYPNAWGKSWTTWGVVRYIGPWTHGGINSSWEIGTMSLFWPKPDPQPVPENGSHYAGNALTFGEGYYESNEASWLMSERFEMAPTLAYEFIRLVYFRCVGLAPLDDGWVHVGFSSDTLPPNPYDLSEWNEVRRYDGENQKFWDYEEESPGVYYLDVTDEFKAQADTMLNYWLLFSLISGPNLERGGWNLDNIEIYGANPI